MFVSKTKNQHTKLQRKKNTNFINRIKYTIPKVYRSTLEHDSQW